MCRGGEKLVYAVSTQNTGFILVLLLTNYYTIFHMNKCKPTSGSIQMSKEIQSDTSGNEL